MTRRRPRSHSILPGDLGMAGPPFLPVLGDVYWVRSLLYSSFDRAPARPAVVIEVPVTPHGRIRIVTRTSDTDAAGVFHQADPALGLAKDGIFANPASVQQEAWCPGDVRRLGRLPDDTFAAVMERFQ